MSGAATAKSLYCMGNLTIDQAVHQGVETDWAVGGDAAYAALAARLFTDDVTMLAPVGPDLPPGLLGELAGAGVRVDELPGRDLPTVRNIIHYRADGTRTWDLQCSEADFDVMSVHPEDVPSRALQADGIVLLAMSLAAQLALTPWLRARTEAQLYLDVQEDYLDDREALLQMISCSDVFLPSEVEATALTGESDLVRAAQAFRALGPHTVVITLADRGVLLSTGGIAAQYLPVDRVQALDSTGAGDAFAGGFAAVHVSTGDAVAAVDAGARAARVAIGATGIAGLLAAGRPHRSQR